jgi:RNA polymerase sigma factor (sigma-70 family)
LTPHISTTLLRTQTDERLVALVAAGHERAFDAIVERYSRPLLRHAQKLLREDGRAEDVVQAAFVSAWTALEAGTAVRDLRPWLYRIVHNGALNAMKKQGGADAPLTEARAASPGPEAEVLQREDVRRALDTISGLPDRQRAALLAVALEGRSHADVGQDLGIDDSAVRQLVSRARRSLRVAATAVTPWPIAAWLAGTGGAQAGDTAARVGEIVGGIGAGGLLGGGVVKAGAIVAATGAVAAGAPQVAHVVRDEPRAVRAAPAVAAPPATVPAGAGTASDSGNGSGTSGSPAPQPAADAARGDDETRDTAPADDGDQSEGGGDRRESRDEHGSRDEQSSSGRGRDRSDDDARSGDRARARERSAGSDKDRSRKRGAGKGERSERSGDDGKERAQKDSGSRTGDDDGSRTVAGGDSRRSSEPAEERDEADEGSGRREQPRGAADRPEKSDDPSVTFGP